MKSRKRSNSKSHRRSNSKSRRRSNSKSRGGAINFNDMRIHNAQQLRGTRTHAYKSRQSSPRSEMFTRLTSHIHHGLTNYTPIPRDVSYNISAQAQIDWKHKHKDYVISKVIELVSKLIPADYLKENNPELLKQLSKILSQVHNPSMLKMLSIAHAHNITIMRYIYKIMHNFPNNSEIHNKIATILNNINITPAYYMPNDMTNKQWRKHLFSRV